VLPTPVDRTILFRALHALIAGKRVEGDITRLKVIEGRQADHGMIRGLKILVGEDNPTNRKVVRKILETGGHSIHIVDHGEQALDALEHGVYDVVILDMHMPVMGGLEAAKQYRFMHPEKRNVPIMILTANATTEAVRQCEAAGLDAYLAKPVEPKKLLETVDLLARNSKRNGRDRSDSVTNPSSSEELEKHPVLEKEVLDGIAAMANSREFMRELVNGYIRDNTALVKRLNEHRPEDGYTRMFDLAHSLDGSSRSIGAVRLSFVASRIAGRDGKKEQYPNVAGDLAQLNAVFRDTVAALRAYLDAYNAAAS